VRASRQSRPHPKDGNAAEAGKSASAHGGQVAAEVRVEVRFALPNARDAEKSARHALHYITMR
jgi:hypothetical protein